MIANDQSIYGAAGWWTAHAPWMRLLQSLVPARFEYFDTIVPTFAGRRVVDVGCGAGFMAEALARRGAHVVGVDPSLAALTQARAHASELRLAIEYRPGVGEALPLASESCDLAVCVDVLEHVADVDRLLAEVARVLVPGGLLLFDTINRTWLAELVMIRLGERVLGLLPRGTHDPALFIRPEELRRALAGAGFAVGDFVGLGPVGVDAHLMPRLGRVSTTAVAYLGAAARCRAPARAQ